MIQKLKRKLVAVIMGVSALILLTVFGFLLVSTQIGMEQQSRNALVNSLDGKGKNSDGKKQESAPSNLVNETETEEDKSRDDDHPKEKRFHCYVVTLTAEGHLTNARGSLLLMESYAEEEILALVQRAAESGEAFGVLPDYHLRFAQRETAAGTLLAFADTSGETTAMGELVKNSLIVGICALLLLFGLSLLLARWTVKPVERAWQQQKQFVGDASHELKTPLTVILSNADMLLRHPEGEKQRWAENIKAESIRMKELTEELLALARTEDTATPLQMELTDLSYLVADSILLFEPTAFEQGKTLRGDIVENLFVRGDTTQLSRLVSILIDNGVKYGAPSSEIVIGLRAVGKYAEFSVINFGTPISPKDLPHLFERFYRADPARHSGGHGLGLSIARSIVQAHKGKIKVESGNASTCFTIQLPLQKPPLQQN